MSESQLLFSKCNLGELLTSSASGGEWTLSKVLPPETKGRRKCKSALPWRGLTSLIFHQELVAAVGRGCSAEGEGGGGGQWPAHSQTSHSFDVSSWNYLLQILTINGILSYTTVRDTNPTRRSGDLFLGQTMIYHFCGDLLSLYKVTFQNIKASDSDQGIHLQGQPFSFYKPIIYWIIFINNI